MMTTAFKQKFFILGAILILAATCLFIARIPYASYLLGVGGAIHTFIRISTPYRGTNLRIKRLQRMQLFSSILIIVASSFMYNEKTEWIICLFCAALFETYASFVMPKEEEKKEEK